MCAAGAVMAYYFIVIKRKERKNIPEEEKASL